ncbi:MAG: hypothetical protein E6I97_27990 [Chloroflexi bacterium]|nr:MAG: hypothetical protein E6I97_27990 [Chloroflexota bacterium]
MIYRHLATPNGSTSGMPNGEHPDEWLAGIANLALMHLEYGSSEPVLLDGMFLLPLHDSSRCSGFLCLGPKFNLEPYGKQDASFLSTLASQLSVLEVNSRYLEQAQADAQQLAALNHRVISAQEEERRHLAFELHDEALQEAMLVVRQLSDASTLAEVAEVMPLARSVVAGLRRTCLELRPPLLDELGLEEAFRWLARQTEEHSGNQLQIQVLCTGCWETRPPTGVELALFPFVWNKVRDAGDQVLYGDFYEYNRSLRDLSAALTRLQGIEQISAFMLPRLATLLNATETSLLLQPLCW